MGEVRTKLTVVDNSTTKLEAINKQLRNMVTLFGDISTQSRKVSDNLQTVAQQTTKVESKVVTLSNATDKLAENIRKGTTNTNKFTSNLRGVDKAVSKLINRLSALASAYLGVMGARALITTSDTITGANNKFTTLGTMEYGMDESAAQAFSNETMDKIFEAAQSSAASYTDMMSNVAKSVTLAGDAFGDSSEQQIDNAIKFQEIMSKSYALGGASAAEMSSSMYQMVQALGSGVLQGDELRSVREGAPLAYKAIEEFAQGVLHTEDSLKDLASEGLITSDLVVSAILDMEGETNKAFENIELTFGQLWNIFKNDVTKAFEPFFAELRRVANTDEFRTFMDNVSSAIGNLADILTWLLGIVEKVIGWIVNNWNTFKSIIIAGATAIGIVIGTFLVNKIRSAVSSFMKLDKAVRMAHLKFVAFVAIIMLAIVFVGWMTDVTGSLTTALGALAMIIGIVMLTIALLGVIGVISLTPITIVLLIIGGILLLLIGIFMAFTEQIMGGLYAIKALFSSVWENIKTLFKNTVLEMQAKFWDFVGSVTSGIKSIADKVNKVLGIFGLEIDTSGLEQTIDSAEAKAKALRAEKGEYIDVGQAVKDAYNEGKLKGQEIHGKIEDFLTGGSNDPWYTNMLNDDYGASQPELDYDLGKDVNDISNNTGDMAKSTELSAEDLKYLRQIAQRDSINKFTTAQIKVDMTNNNTVNNTSDLRGIATSFRRMLEEELNVAAKGVHV